MYARLINVGKRWKSTGDLMKDCGWEKLVCRANKLTEVERKNPQVEMRKICPSHVGLSVPLVETVTHDISMVDMTPPDVLNGSVAIIRRRPKVVTQQGTDSVGTWELTFATKERWENPCMGWCSASYPYSNISLFFESAEDASAFCNRRGWSFDVEDDSNRTKPKKMIKKWYGENFAWNKRVRVSTK